jgi:hypothetical protein
VESFNVRIKNHELSRPNKYSTIITSNRVQPMSSYYFSITDKTSIITNYDGGETNNKRAITTSQTSGHSKKTQRRKNYSKQ